MQKSKISESESSINSRTCLGHLVLFFQYPPRPDFEKAYLLSNVRIFWKIDPKEKLVFFRGRQVHKLELLFKFPICWRSHCYYWRGQVQNQSILQDFVRTWYDAMKFVIYIYDPSHLDQAQLKKIHLIEVRFSEHPPTCQVWTTRHLLGLAGHQAHSDWRGGMRIGFWSNLWIGLISIWI